MAQKNALPNYENPPVTEVVCGILFQPLSMLTAPYLGTLWEKFKPTYPRCKEVAPLAPVIERFDEGPERSEVPFERLFSLSRTWFETTDGNGLIQVQRDRFLHNWKKERDNDRYPHYDYVIENFRNHLQQFEAFLDENKLGVVEPLQYELTYVNHILKGAGWITLDEVKRVFTDFSWRGGSSRFLPTPETINWRTTFLLTNQVGRLHASIRSAKRRTDGQPVLLFELTARGIGANKSRDAMWEWFDLAHEWIVQGFTDLTSEEIQKTIWRRKR
jgi:uncharacterized protein (TIGR04255 family)